MSIAKLIWGTVEQRTLARTDLGTCGWSLCLVHVMDRLECCIYGQSSYVVHAHGIVMP